MLSDAELPPLQRLLGSKDFSNTSGPHYSYSSAPHKSSSGGNSELKPSTASFPWREMWWVGALNLAPIVYVAMKALSPICVATCSLGAIFLRAVLIWNPDFLHLFPTVAVMGMRNAGKLLEPFQLDSFSALEGLRWRFLRCMGWLMAVHSGLLMAPEPMVLVVFSMMLDTVSLVLMSSMKKFHGSVPTGWMAMGHAVPIFLLIVVQVGMILDVSNDKAVVIVSI